MTWQGYDRWCKPTAWNGPSKSYWCFGIFQRTPTGECYPQSVGEYSNGNKVGVLKNYFDARDYWIPLHGMNSLEKVSTEIAMGIVFTGETVAEIMKEYCPYGPISAYYFPPNKAGKLWRIRTLNLKTGMETVDTSFFKYGCTGPY